MAVSVLPSHTQHHVVSRASYPARLVSPPARDTRMATSLQLPPTTMTKTDKRRAPRNSATITEEVLASDQAFVDLILDKGHTLPRKIKWWEDLVEVETTTGKIRNADSDKGLCVAVCHTVKYKNEVIWRFQTKSTYGIHGVSGQSASCTFMRSKGTVRVKIIHKTRNCLAEGTNAIEIRNYNILSMVLKSGEARQREVETAVEFPCRRVGRRRSSLL